MLRVATLPATWLETNSISAETQPRKFENQAILLSLRSKLRVAQHRKSILRSIFRKIM